MHYGATGASVAGVSATGTTATALAFTGSSFIGISIVVGVMLVLLGAFLYRMSTRTRKYAP